MTGIAIEPRPEAVVQNQVSKRQWLVTTESSMDELPVRLFDTLAEAKAFIRVSPPYPSHDTENNSPDVLNAYKLGDKDIGNVYGLTLYQFADGKPFDRTTFFWSDSDSGWAAAEGYFVKDGPLEESHETGGES